MSRKRASKASSRLARGPSRRRREASTSQASGPRSRSSRSKIVPPRMIASRAEGGKAGALPLAKPRADGGAEQRHLAGVVLGGSLDQPGPSQVAKEATRPPGRRQAIVVGADHDLDVEALGGAAQRGERVLAGGAAVEVVVVEDVQLAGHRPAGQVAPSRRRRRQASGGEEGVGGGEPARASDARSR